MANLDFELRLAKTILQGRIQSNMIRGTRDHAAKQDDAKRFGFERGARQKPLNWLAAAKTQSARSGQQRFRTAVVSPGEVSRRIEARHRTIKIDVGPLLDVIMQISAQQTFGVPKSMRKIGRGGIQQQAG